MKGKTLKLVMGGLVALIVLASIITSFGQSRFGDGMEIIPTGKDMLAKILSETNIIPLEIYPPGHLEWLLELGDAEIPNWGVDDSNLYSRNDPDPNGFPDLAANHSIFIKKVQTGNTPFEQAGGNHKYVGQLIKPSTFVGISQINMEMKNLSGMPTVDAEIWQTDLGNNWVFIAATASQSINGDYAMHTWDFTTPVILSPNHSYFVGVYVASSYILMRGDNSGSAGTGANLGNGIGSPDGYYQQSWGSSHNNDQGGAGTGWYTTYSIITDDTAGQSLQLIVTLPNQLTFAGVPSKGSGKDNLILVTHGWNPDMGWLEAMTNSIQQYLNSHSMSTWQVVAYKWPDNANTGVLPSDAQKALENGKQEGINLGNGLGAQGWTHIHLVAHSAGAGLIQRALERIKAISPSTVVHSTFLDPFTGFDYEGVANYGNGADWSDQYFSRDSKTQIGGIVTTGPFTESLLDHAYNVDVTPLDPNKLTGITKFRSATGALEPCHKTLTSHGWPHDFYENTITGSVTSDYAGHGFPLSKEGGGWSSAVPSYTRGNSPAQLLGTPDPTCTTEVQLTPPSYNDTLIDFTQTPAIQSDTGTIQKWVDSLKLFTGSPAWVASAVSNTNPVNVVSFDAQFSSTNGAQGLLSVYWDTVVIGTIDERITNAGHYTFKFPNAAANSSHILGLRLDPFTNIQSVVTITNIALNQIGVSQPFSLSLIINSVTNGLIYELSGEAGFEYNIQASTNLIDWTDIAILANTNGAVQFYDVGATNYPMRFYRGVASY